MYPSKSTKYPHILVLDRKKLIKNITFVLRNFRAGENYEDEKLLRLVCGTK